VFQPKINYNLLHEHAKRFAVAATKTHLKNNAPPIIADRPLAMQISDCSDFANSTAECQR